MPWNVKKTDRCPSSKPWGVIGGKTGDYLAGCHPDRESGLQQAKALYANDPGPTKKSEEPVMYSTPTTIPWPAP
jgi:hypothetical protein